MHFAVIPLVVWLVLAALGGAGVSGGGVALHFRHYWSAKDQEKIKESHRNNAGVVDVIADPMICVDLYYHAVRDCDYKQYQFCVVKPISEKNFTTKARDCNNAKEKSGIGWTSQPVKGRTDVMKRRWIGAEAEGTVVVAISPWSGDETSFKVVRYGQGWRIYEEE